MSIRSSNDNELLRIVLIVLAVVILGPFLLMALAVPMMGLGGGGMMGGGMMGGSSGGFGVLGFVFQLLWLVVLIGGGYLIYRRLAGSGAIGSDSALEELRVAYARGEITNEEFEERQLVLSGENRGT